MDRLTWSKGKDSLAGGSDPAALQLEIALYIENLAAELRAMAGAAELEALAYFLEMARVEASIQVEKRASS